MTAKNITRGIVFTALFAALISACAFISIPVPGTPIPIVLQNLMVVLTGMLLGPVMGTAATLVFILAGVIGLPVFSGGTGGMARIMGPTGGFIIGYAVATLAAGLVAGRPRLGKGRQLARLVPAAVLGFTVMYVPGVFHFMNTMQKNLHETLALCVFPYIPGDLVKMVVSILLSVPLRKTAATLIFKDEVEDDQS